MLNDSIKNALKPKQIWKWPKLVPNMAKTSVQVATNGEKCISYVFLTLLII